MGFSLGSILPAVGAGLGGLIGIAGGPIGMVQGAALGTALGAPFSAKEAADAQQEANDRNIALTRETNATSIELANTAHQREVADLKAAGLNPILSAKYGGSATPSLTSPSMSSSAPIIQANAKQSSDIAFNNMQYQLQTQLQKSQVEVNSAQAMKSKMEAVNAAVDAKTKAAKLPAVASQAKLEKEAADHRRARPQGANEAGWDISDAMHTFTGGLMNLFK